MPWHMKPDDLVRPFLWVAGKFWRPIQRVFAIRRGLAHPERSGQSLGDKSAEKTLGQLGAQLGDRAWHSRWATAVTRLGTKDGVFGLPYMNEWLSQEDVKARLKSLHEDDLARSPRDTKKLAELNVSFQTKSGDNAAQGHYVIRAVLAALEEAGNDAIIDKGVGAMVQASTTHIQRNIASVSETVENIRANLAVRASDGARTFNDQQALKELDKLLVLRALPGKQFVPGLEQLSTDVRDGRFSIVRDETKARVLNWLARARAWDGDVESAQALLDETAKMGGKPDLPTRANFEAAKGNVENALRLAQTEDTPDCRSAFLGLLGKYKETAAEPFLLGDRLDDPSRFTANGWINALAILINNSHFTQARIACDALTQELLLAQPYLSFIRGVVFALDVVPEDRRLELARNGPDTLIFGSLDGPVARQSRDCAIASFDRAIVDSHRLELEAPEFERACLLWARMLRLTNEQLKVQEVLAIQAEMKDPGTAVDVVRLAQTHRIEVDTAQLEAYLSRQDALIGLTNEERVAKGVVFALKEQWAQLADFLEANWSRLLGIVDVRALMGQMIDALTKNQELSRADDFLRKHAGLITPQERDRLALLIVQARGGDLASSAAALYEKTQSLVDLRNLVAALGSQRRWKDAFPFSRMLFDKECNHENAMSHLEIARRARVSTEDVLAFIEHAQPRIAISRDFTLAKATALFLRGRNLESKSLVDQLRVQRHDVRDFALDLNLARQAGDWERFPALLEQAWQARDQFDESTLLLIANMAGLTDPAKALDLASEATQRAGADAGILMGAYTLAVQLGRDEVGSAWIAKVVAEQQGNDGVVKQHTMRQTMEILEAQREAWQQKSDDFRTAKYPIHLAAVLFNAPLTRFMVQMPRANAEESDARRRTPIPFRSGRRASVDCSKRRSAVLDVTTIFHAHELGILDKVLGHFSEIHIASQTFRLLLEETQRVVFHQPSRIVEAKQFLNAVDRRKISAVTDVAPRELARKVGVELATLLAQAQRSQSLVVHDGDIFELGSYMEVIADLGALRDLVIRPLDVAYSLAAKGYITDLALSNAKDILGRSNEVPQEPKEIDLAKIYLDSSGIGALQRANLVQDFLQACPQACVHQSTIQEWRSLVDYEGEGTNAQQVIDRIRRTLHAGLLAGKIQLLPPATTRPDSFIGEKGMALFDLAASGGVADVVFLDDRLLNRDAFVADLQQRQVPLASTLDLLDLLVSNGQMTSLERDDAYHQLRRRCMYCVPLNLDSLTQMVSSARIKSTGELLETAHLKILREYIARLISADALCTEDDRVFLDSLWTVGSIAIRKLWEDSEVSIQRVIAASNWIMLSVVPSIDAAIRGLNAPADKLEEIAAVRAINLTTALIHDEERAAAHRKWADVQVLGKLLPANGLLLDQIAARVEEATLYAMRKVADDASR